MMRARGYTVVCSPQLERSDFPEERTRSWLQRSSETHIALPVSHPTVIAVSTEKSLLTTALRDGA